MNYKNFNSAKIIINLSIFSNHLCTCVYFSKSYSFLHPPPPPASPCAETDELLTCCPIKFKESEVVETAGFQYNAPFAPPHVTTTAEYLLVLKLLGERLRSSE